MCMANNLTSKIAIYCASMFNGLWILGIFLNNSISPISQFTSFYASSCEPYNWFFRVIDVGFFISTMVWCFFSYNQYNKILWFAILAVGMATLGDACFPPGCLSSGALHPSIFNELSHIHAITSSIGFTATYIIICTVAFTLIKRKWYKLFIILLFSITTVLLLQYNYHMIIQNNSIVGLVQRALILLFSCWLILVPLTKQDAKKI